MSDFIPKPDSDFNNWVINYSDYVRTNFAALGLTAGQNTALQALLTRWQTDYPAHIAGQATARSLTQKKDTTRDQLEVSVRELTGIIQSTGTVTNEQKASLGITIQKDTKTPTPIPISRPIAVIDNKNRLEQILQFFDESTPNSKAKPLGVRGCEIWTKIGGTPPVDEKELKYVATDTKSPYLVRFAGEDGGKIAHYWLRWVNTRNEPGPWSETISATVSA